MRVRAIVLAGCAFVCAGAGISVASCASPSPAQDGESTERFSEPLAISAIHKLTQVYVADAGALDVETEYLPQVVCCENGAAPKEALRAQAVMARSYMYYRNGADGLGAQGKPFKGTQSDQAYHCAQPTSQACRDAVSATDDQIASYTNTSGTPILNVAFYIDGPKPGCNSGKSCTCAVPSPSTVMSPADHPSGCDCFTFVSDGAANPAYLTYNWANSGTNVKGSTLGDPSNESNRGCASQNIQACLGYAGWQYVDQLKFFYGQDVELRHADGTLLSEPTPDDGGATPGPTPEGDGGNHYLPAFGNKADADGPGCSVSTTTAGFGSESSAALVLIALALFGGRRRKK